MIIKVRSESLKLKIYRQLFIRQYLSELETSYYLKLEKGYQGEMQFDKMVDHLSNNWLILNDLQLEHNNTNFQIDKVIIAPSKIYLFEIKNYEGDYYINDNRWYSISNQEISNPLFQLQRSESSFRRLLISNGFQLPIEANIIFINPDFYLYNAPLNLPIVFPTQLKRFINQITNFSQNLKETHNKIADSLISLHLQNYPFTNLPEFQFEKFKKGIICPACLKMYTNKSINGYLVCSFCTNKESIEKAVLRSIYEFKLLFPEHTITSKIMVEWCKIISKRYLQRALTKNFKLKEHGRSSYYV